VRKAFHLSAGCMYFATWRRFGTRLATRRRFGTRLGFGERLASRTVFAAGGGGGRSCLTWGGRSG
jgi:hypothetical protein